MFSTDELKIFYHTDEELSLRRAAASYRAILRERCALIEARDHVTDADLIVLHSLPHSIEFIYRKFPFLRKKYVIGYVVWETDELPKPFEKTISYVQEIWTSSQYCCNVLRKYHDRVIHVPHVVESNVDCSDDDRAYIKKAIGHEQDCIYFLQVVRVSDVRKNVMALIKAFRNTRGRMKKARLIIKGSGRADPVNFISDQQIIYLREDLTQARLNALYELSNVYVSAHHSEGWGLTLSDAMIFRKPVIATGYSGNLDFMDDTNSFLVNFTEENIHPEDCTQLFKSHMKWAYPDQADLEAKLLFLYDALHHKQVAEKVDRASVSIENFNRSAVGFMIDKRLKELEFVCR